MIKKFIYTALLLLLLLFFQSFIYCVLTLIAISFVWRLEFKKLFPWRFSFTLLVGTFVLILWGVMPQYRISVNKRQQLIYQDENGNPMSPPVTHYLFNVVFPEEEIINMGIWAVRLGSNFTDKLGLDSSLVNQFKSEATNGIDNFYIPMRKLNWSGQFMMSGTTSQLFNMQGWGEKTKSVYLITPKNYNPDKKYPVVFFCHGYLGNWKLYQSLLNELDECFVLSLSTETWNGRFTENDIANIFEKQIPFFAKMGYQIDANDLHLIGLSNGGTASDIAYKNYNEKFKTIVYISSDINQTYHIPSRVLLIGGGKDADTQKLPDVYKKIKSNGGEVALYWDDYKTHYVFVQENLEIIEFLKREMKFSNKD